MQSRSKAIAAAWAAGTSVPASVPAEGVLERAGRRGSWRARRRPRAGSGSRRSRPRRAPAPSLDPVGADHPGDADVDHLRVGDVERDPPQRQQDRDPDREPANRGERDQRPGALARPQPGDQQPDEQVAEHRVGEGDRGGDLGPVEEEQRDAEPEHDEQVEVQQAQRAARIEERGDEEQAERQPDPGRVDLLGDRALVSPRQPGARPAGRATPPRSRRCGRRGSPRRPGCRPDRRRRPASARRGSGPRAAPPASRRAPPAPPRSRPRARSPAPPGSRSPAAARRATSGSTARRRLLAAERRLVGRILRGRAAAGRAATASSASAATSSKRDRRVISGRG